MDSISQLPIHGKFIAIAVEDPKIEQIMKKDQSGTYPHLRLPVSIKNDGKDYRVDVTSFDIDRVSLETAKMTKKGDLLSMEIQVPNCPRCHNPVYRNIKSLTNQKEFNL